MVSTRPGERGQRRQALWANINRASDGIHAADEFTNSALRPCEPDAWATLSFSNPIIQPLAFFMNTVSSSAVVVVGLTSAGPLS
jgi:hypothetical protein